MIRREAFENLMAWVAEAQHLRVILQDLIAELWNDYGEDNEWIARRLNRAEARLKELGDNDE